VRKAAWGCTAAACTGSDHEALPVMHVCANAPQSSPAPHPLQEKQQWDRHAATRTTVSDS
jgi:hypothetical protein